MQTAAKTSYVYYSMIALILLAWCLLTNCGSTKPDKKKKHHKSGEVDKAFSDAGNQNSIPVRLMMAAAYLESGISPVEQSAPYYDPESQAQKVELGMTLTQTAFGITREELAIDKNELAGDLKVQIAAYGAWLRKKIDEDASFKLKDNPGSSDEKYWWLWKLAQFHRNGDELTRNIRVLWALHMMKILNEGFVWQDPASGEVLELKKESPPLVPEKLQPDARSWLNLEFDASDIQNARMFELTSENNTSLVNTPTHIEVIHCPLTLSACLELQDSTLDNEVALGAHYVIPQDEALVPRALQIAQHQQPVTLTDKNGHRQQITDAIVIMLVGNSGQYEAGLRVNADPTWFTAWQLKKLGAVIGGVCKSIAQRYDVNVKTCQSPEEANGVHFHHQGLRNKYRWGDIPDFDKSIFYAYLRTSSHDIEAEVAMQFANQKRTYAAGDAIEFLNTFHPGVSYITLQRAMRCDDKQLVWETVRSDPIKDKTTHKHILNILDGGPNGNGRHFLRVLVKNENAELSGWAISDLYLKKFDTDVFPHADACTLRNLSDESSAEN